MAIRIRIAAAFMVSGISLATLPALSAELTEDMRASARTLAGQEIAIAKHDLKGFCTATYGSPEYASYTARACHFWLKNNMKKPDDCTEANIQQEIRKGIGHCLEMSGSDFDKQILNQRKEREVFIAKMRKAGMDGEKLLHDELAKLPAAQSKPGSPSSEQTGAQYCEYSKSHVETLKSILMGNSVKMSDAMRASMQRDLVASEKEAATCCSDLDQCKRAFEAPTLAEAADIDVKDGNTPLHLAVKEGKADLVSRLVAKGADVNARDGKGCTPLFYAKSREVAELLITKGADVNAKRKNGSTPLHAQANLGHADVAELLISRGANVNAKNKSGTTPLHQAKSREVAELLIAKSAKVNAKNDAAWTPLHMAVSRELKDVVELLISKGADVHTNSIASGTAIHLAARSGNKDIVEMLLNSGVNVNVKDEKGEAPLHAAMTTGNKDLIVLLIAKGADVLIRNKEEETPLHAAVAHMVAGNSKIQMDVFDLLLGNGAQVNAQDNGGRTALHWAAHLRDKEIAQWLIAKGADVNAKQTGDFAGITPLFWAENKDIATLLIVHGADSKAKAMNDYTPLHAAAGNNKKDIVELLITKGVDVNAKDKDGRTPLSYAVENKHNEIVELLRKHGAK